MELLIFKLSLTWGDKYFTCQQVAHVKVMIISHQSVCISTFAFIPRKVKLHSQGQIVKWKSEAVLLCLNFLHYL